ncbi:Hsp20 family protein [Hyphomicrobiales bacterium]|uniref:Hsp20 family protein n=1 Tax=Rhizobium sp. Rhizsp82 TaxID=3243057 RepID=UPI000DD5D8EF
MRNELDFSPLYRSSVGFDRVVKLLNNSQRLQAVDFWPHYDIVKTGEDEYRISMAVAGFDESDLDITQDRNFLVVKGSKAEDQQGEYLHRGIPARSFERRFELADHVWVEDASLASGLLTVSLRREIPDALRLRKIAIGSGSQDTVLQIDANRHTA